METRGSAREHAAFAARTVVLSNRDLVALVCAALGGVDLARAAAVSRVFAAACSSRAMWQRALVATFPSAAGDAADAADAAALRRLFARRHRAVARGADAEPGFLAALRSLKTEFRWSLDVAVGGSSVLSATFFAGPRRGGQLVPRLRNTRATVRLVVHSRASDTRLAELDSAGAAGCATATLIVERLLRAWGRGGGGGGGSTEAAAVLVDAPVQVVQGAGFTTLGVLSNVTDDPEEDWMDSVDKDDFCLLVNNAAFAHFMQGDEQYLALYPSLYILLPRELPPPGEIARPEVWLSFVADAGRGRIDDASDEHMLELLQHLRWE